MADNIQSREKRLPSWLKRGIIDVEETRFVRRILSKFNLNTVCEGARCPNKGECYAARTATFMVMGNKCSRGCRFCSVGYASDLSLDAEEPLNVARAVSEMGLAYVVITSVTRDDLKDGGAAHFVETVTRIKELTPQVAIEVLVPDFQGDSQALEQVLKSPINVFNHNIETVKELYSLARPEADYRRSLDILSYAKTRYPEIVTKSGFMLGLGETLFQVEGLLKDLRASMVDIVTIGQYIQPVKQCLPVERYYTPEEFQEVERMANNLGLSNVVAGPLIRSSYKACMNYQDIKYR